MKAEFYPRTDKSKLFALGYVATRSAHSRGSTVDLGIVAAGAPKTQPLNPAAPLLPCHAPKGQRFDDGTIDFGTAYDCLDVAAGIGYPGMTAQARTNRLFLRELMRSAGFKPYDREWWHFQLSSEPFPTQVFDFAISARMKK
jgi:D-alanyl-D-alanine dipeptidase